MDIMWLLCIAPVHWTELHLAWNGMRMMGSKLWKGKKKKWKREDRFKEDYYFLLRLLGLLLLYSLQADVFGWLLDVVLGQLRKRWR